MNQKKSKLKTPFVLFLMQEIKIWALLIRSLSNSNHTQDPQWNDTRDIRVRQVPLPVSDIHHVFLYKPV